ncbi:TSUP family transporter [Leucobacter sp. GX24907]
MVSVPLVIACVVVLIASVVQHITGLGFALVAAPALVLVYGAVDGVKAVVVLGLVVSIAMLLSMFRDVHWSRAWRLVLGGAVAAPLAAWVTFLLPPPALLMCVGAAALLSLVGGRIMPVGRGPSGTPGALVTGAASGFLHVTSGLSGPPLVVYGVRNRWEQRSFVATLQVVFIAFHLFTLGLRGVPELPGSELLVLVVVALVGLGVGILIRPAIRDRWAHRGMLLVAWVGAIAVLVRGIQGVLF